MGRKRDKTITLAVTSEDLSMFERAAREYGMPVDAWLYWDLRKRLRRRIEEWRRTRAPHSTRKISKKFVHGHRRGAGSSTTEQGKYEGFQLPGTIRHGLDLLHKEFYQVNWDSVWSDWSAGKSASTQLTQWPRFEKLVRDNDGGLPTVDFAKYRWERFGGKE